MILFVFAVRDFVVVVGLTGICRRLLDDKTTIFWACRALGTSKCLLIGDYQLHDLRFYVIIFSYVIGGGRRCDNRIL